jgi:mRNA-degrading endonuclease RelE of RelBE toxin-antitoxin system
MAWAVKLHRNVEKQVLKLPSRAIAALYELMANIRKDGPVRVDWPNYSKLTGNRHHCHLKKGSPTYVAVWQVTDKTINLVEVQYAGTHEKAPY